ncbi:hypothetical protein DUNSADRAFT_6140 [Dunaliella salina]|uniref:Snurportin-1 n=1 Tax=Dunaliella salina TaxID=3046 RepID=A0ABQ7GNW7_DUNSA|nr:hypothetical protein DUNSADRAFT_6140 [Dunaliella salina]KAF5836311.1 hypothetical protein DUNSADRAFT_6140 [Dunaliella salina]|eukprot:KAF5836310.1 hypothetical protein DUNSADRAFT_6140 [Dunaliella salina]
MSRHSGISDSSRYALLQQKRRDEALARQKHARMQQFNLARAVQKEDVGTEQERIGAAAQQFPSSTTAADECSIQPQGEEEPSSSGATGQAEESMADQDTSCSTGSPQQQAGRKSRGRGRGRGVSGTHAQRIGAGDRGFTGAASGAQGVEDMEEAPEGEEHPRVMFARQLQHPEWMTDVPQDLQQNWLVMPRPEGQRCLVVTSKGRTVVRGRTGAVLCMTSTGLPEGSHATAAACSDFCVLDAIWHEPNSTLYICDVLVWRGYSLVDCAAEFRAFWLSNKLGEDPEATRAMAHWDLLGGEKKRQQQQQQQGKGVHMDQDMEQHQLHQQQQQQQQGEGLLMDQDMEQQQSQHQQQQGEGVQVDHELQQQQQQQQQQHGTPKRHGGYASVPRMRVVRLPLHTANADGIRAAYQGVCTAPGGPQGVARDGLLFVHKEGRYESGAVGTPLVLQWKDAGCSKYPIDTAPDGSPLPYQVVTLEYRMDSTVSTSDVPPVVLGVMPQQWVQAMGPKLLRPGRLLKFSVREARITREVWPSPNRPPPRPLFVLADAWGCQHQHGCCGLP